MATTKSACGFYDAASDGATLWDNDYRSVPVTNGVFTYLLGDSTALPASILAGNAARWLGVKVGADVEIAPRTRLISSPYAYKALNADTVANIRDGVIVDADLSPAANIAAAKIAGTAATLAASNTFTGTSNTFENDLYVGPDGDMVVNGNDLVLRSGGRYRWRVHDDSTTGFQVKQIYDNSNALKNKIRLDINDEGYMAIDTFAILGSKLRINFPTTGDGIYDGVKSFVSNTADAEIHGISVEARNTSTMSGGPTTGISSVAKSDRLERCGIHSYAGMYSGPPNNGSTYGIFTGGQWGVDVYGIYASATLGTHNYAGYFSGNVNVTGTLSKGGGGFLIDHPLDPENKYLQHSFVESPDMKNIYDGVVTLDADGKAAVELPSYFEAENRDFRYQLTAIGAPCPGLYVSTEVKDNRFEIAGGQPGAKVSWQVTGIRQDRWAEANRLKVEFEKDGDQRGRYLHHEEYGQSTEKSINYKQFRKLEKMRQDTQTED